MANAARLHTQPVSRSVLQEIAEVSDRTNQMALFIHSNVFPYGLGLNRMVGST